MFADMCPAAEAVDVQGSRINFLNPDGGERGVTGSAVLPAVTHVDAGSWDSASATVRSLVLRGTHTEALGQLLGEVLPTYLASGAYRGQFTMLESRGVHLSQVGHYSPIPDTRTLEPSHWQRISPLPGIDLNEDAQVRILRDVFPRFEPEYSQLPISGSKFPILTA